MQCLQQQQQRLMRQRQQPAAAASRCRRPRCRAAVQCQAGQQQVLVKVCGITNPADAQFAAQQGADLIGMIMWPKAKRSVSSATAAAIAAAAKQGGAAPVGVFVDEDGPTIAAACRAAGIGIAQLHGDASRACLADLPEDLQVVFVLQADDNGRIVTPVPGTPGGPELPRTIDWLLVDGMTGGSGKAFSWTDLQVPTRIPSRGWLLAGGLHPGNVGQAVAVAKPSAVDVSSGVCGPDGLLKDHSKVSEFISQAKESAAAAAAAAAPAAAKS